MRSPIISLIIPVYNSAAYLPNCLESLFKQSFGDIEFIFVNDCSTDDSVKVISSIIERYPNLRDNIKLINHTTNKGVSTARNTGLNASRGNYIGWVDPDDWVDPYMFENLYSKALAENADIVWCDYTNVYENHTQYCVQNIENNAIACIQAMINGRLLGGMCTKFIKKELFVENNITFPEGLNMCEDMRVNIQLFYHASKIAYLPYGGYFYVKHKHDSISTKATQESKVNKEWIKNVAGIVEFIQSHLPLITKLELDLFKLGPKKNLLIKGRTIESFKLWKSIFPESNYAIQHSSYPLIYKFLAYIIEKEWWPIARLWIYIKYTIFNK